MGFFYSVWREVY